MNKIITSAVAIALASLASVSIAKDGPDQYPHGAESFMAGALPPPGTYFLNYFGHYSGSLRDGAGNEVRPGGETVDVDAWFDALRFVHVTDVEVFGASVAMQAIVPLVRQSIDIAPLGGRRTVSGLGDISLNPFILGWHRGNLHITTGVDFYLPTGRYDVNDPRAQIGANYYSVEPVLAFTYRTPEGFEASSKFMYNIKGNNRDTDVRSGNELHVDLLVGWHSGGWGFGLGGYVVNQTGNDRLHGVSLPGSDSNAIALGPNIQYADARGRQFTAQWQHEFDVENRFEGDKLWFKYAMPL